ncbi:MAG TPA: hypothetical protein VMT88_07460 [Actinomycetes bacterium]|nr:hypothetical protein [Actinomycetes bacterium]
MAGFFQIIEFKTSQIDEIKAMGEKFRDMRQSEGDTSVVRGTVAEDRDRPGTYLNIVEFESYEKAMANSERPDTQEFSARMMELCDGPPKFYNLDVKQVWQV